MSSQHFQNCTFRYHKCTFQCRGAPFAVSRARFYVLRIPKVPIFDDLFLQVPIGVFFVATIFKIQKNSGKNKCPVLWKKNQWQLLMKQKTTHLGRRKMFMNIYWTSLPRKPKYRRVITVSARFKNVTASFAILPHVLEFLLHVSGLYWLSRVLFTGRNVLPIYQRV